MPVVRGNRPQPGQLALFEPETDKPGAAMSATDAPMRPASATLPAGESTAAMVGTGSSDAQHAHAMSRRPDRVASRRAAGTVGTSPPMSIGSSGPRDASTRLDAAIPRYLAALAAQGRSQHTLKSFELDLRLLQGQLGNRAVGSIDLNHLRQFIAWVRLTRQNSPNSLRRKVATMKSFFGYLRDEGYLPSNIADQLLYPEAFVALPEFLADDDAIRLVEATAENPFWRTLIVLLLDTGLKRDEVLALRVGDVHMDGPEGERYLVVRETDAAKRLRSRRIPLSDRLVAALRAYGPPARGDARLFDVSIRGVNFIVEVCGERAGIITTKPRLTPQVLRETFAVSQMRARVHDERRQRSEGRRDEALQLLALRHDAEVLELLGLKDDPDTARKYRQLVGAG
jgi:site-specific recombinase XerD